MFSIRKVDETFHETAPWKFEFTVELNVSPKRAFGILLDGRGNDYWQPEVIELGWDHSEGKEGGGPGSIRKLKYSSILSKALLFGPVTIHEEFDTWQDGSNGEDNTKLHLGWHFAKIGRPAFMMYSAGREDYYVEPIDGDSNKCRLTRKCSFEPSYLSRFLLGCIVYKQMKKELEINPAKKLVQGVNEGALPMPNSTA